jgi:hypothetical protein
MPASEPRTRYLGYGGLGLLLLAVVLFGVATTETRYENVVSRTKGVVLSKELRHQGQTTIYGVTYRVMVGGRAVQREGDVGSQRAWDALHVGDEVDVETVGDTANETRLPVERTAGSPVWYGLAAAALAGGTVLLIVRFRRRQR